MAAELQRSATSYRRQGSSGVVWDDKFLAQLDKITQEQEQLKDKNNQQTETKLTVAVGSTSTIERSRSTGGGRGFRTGKVSPAIEPPSPRVSACGFCSAFGKRQKRQNRGRGKTGRADRVMV